MANEKLSIDSIRTRDTERFLEPSLPVLVAGDDGTSPEGCSPRLLTQFSNRLLIELLLICIHRYAG